MSAAVHPFSLWIFYQGGDHEFEGPRHLKEYRFPPPQAPTALLIDICLLSQLTTASSKPGEGTDSPPLRFEKPAAPSMPTWEEIV